MQSSASGVICRVNLAAVGKCRTRLETDVPKAETVKSIAVGDEKSNTFQYCYPNQPHSRPSTAKLHKTLNNVLEGDRTPRKCSVREYGIQCDIGGDERDWKKTFLVNNSTQTSPERMVSVSTETVTHVDQFIQMGLQPSELLPLERKELNHEKERNCSKSRMLLKKETISDSGTVTDMDKRSVFCVKDVYCEGSASSTESNLRHLVHQKDLKLPIVHVDKFAQIGDLDLQEPPQKIECAQMCSEKKEHRRTSPQNHCTGSTLLEWRNLPEETSNSPTEEVEYQTHVLTGGWNTRRRYRTAFTVKDRRSIVSFLLEHGVRSVNLGGNEIWKQMEISKVCPDHTWQSMKEHYRRKILPVLGKEGPTEHSLMQYLDGR